MKHYPPVLVPCSIKLGDGTELDGNCDLDLARKWVQHTMRDQWEGMSETDCSTHIGAALHELRRAAAGESIDLVDRVNLHIPEAQPDVPPGIDPASEEWRRFEREATGD